MASEADRDIDAIERQIAETEQTTPAVGDTVELITAREFNRARARLSLVVIWAYVSILGVITVYIIAADLLDGRPGASVAVLLDMAKTLVLPVVTFVVGHYFGASSR